MRVSLRFSIAAVGASIGLAGADEFKPPPMKDGLWESHSALTLQGKTVSNTSTRMCQSKELTKSTQSVGDAMKKTNQCTSVVSQPSANTFAEESRCAKGPSAGTVTKIVYTYQGDTASHTEMHTHEGGSETVMVIDMKYLGSCPAGMKPGDAVMADGTKMNLGGK